MDSSVAGAIIGAIATVGAAIIGLRAHARHQKEPEQRLPTFEPPPRLPSLFADAQESVSPRLPVTDTDAALAHFATQIQWHAKPGDRVELVDRTAVRDREDNENG